MPLPPRLLNDPNPREQLRLWLADKPFEWSTALAVRSGLRALPWAFANAGPEWIDRYALANFHALFVAWSTLTSPIKGHKFAAELSANMLYPAAMYHTPEAFFSSGLRSISLAIASKRKADKIDLAIRSLFAFDKLIQERVDHRPPDGFLLSHLDEDTVLLYGRGDHKNYDAKRLLRTNIVAGAYATRWGNYLNTA